MMTEDLVARVRDLEAINDIRNLMADYTHFFDTGWAGAGCDATKVGSVFTEDATWGGDGGSQTGRANIEKWLSLIHI